MHYRATPHATTRKSPYELLFGRQMQTALPRLAPELAVCDDYVRHDHLTAKFKSKVYALKYMKSKATQTRRLSTVHAAQVEQAHAIL